MSGQHKFRISKAHWIERYGGQLLLDAEGFDVVPCVGCGDSVCHGWRVVPKSKEDADTDIDYGGVDADLDFRGEGSW